MPVGGAVVETTEAEKEMIGRFRKYVIETALSRATLTNLLKEALLCDNIDKVNELKKVLDYCFDAQVKRLTNNSDIDIRADYISMYLQETARICHDKEKDFKQRKYNRWMIIATLAMVFVATASIVANVMMQQFNISFYVW